MSSLRTLPWPMDARAASDLSNEQIREIFYRAAKNRPKDQFLQSLAATVVSATAADLNILRPAAQMFIERLRL